MLLLGAGLGCGARGRARGSTVTLAHRGSRDKPPGARNARAILAAPCGDRVLTSPRKAPDVEPGRRPAFRRVVDDDDPPAWRRRLPLGPRADPRFPPPVPRRGDLRGPRRPRHSRPAAHSRGARRSALPGRLPRGDRSRAGGVLDGRSPRSPRRQDDTSASARLRGSSSRLRREALAQWEAIKDSESHGSRSALAGVPRALPALHRAQRVQHKAARVGFDWADAAGALEKVREELGEVTEALHQGGGRGPPGGAGRPPLLRRQRGPARERGSRRRAAGGRRSVQPALRVDGRSRPGRGPGAGRPVPRRAGTALVPGEVPGKTGLSRSKGRLR